MICRKTHDVKQRDCLFPEVGNPYCKQKLVTKYHQSRAKCMTECIYKYIFKYIKMILNFWPELGGVSFHFDYMT